MLIQSKIMPNHKYDNAYEWFCKYIDRHPEEAIAYLGG
jgi:hypothetical protein